MSQSVLLIRERFSRRLLDDYQVATVPGAVFGAAGEGYVRLSLTVDESNSVKRWNACSIALGRFFERQLLSLLTSFALIACRRR
jgi:aspartate/methionine/tyrosine aminotransferase